MDTVEDWKNIALWLADVHAATAFYTIDLKSAAKYEKMRERDICATALKMLRTGVPRGPWSPRSSADVEKRLDEVLKYYDKVVPPKGK